MVPALLIATELGKSPEVLTGFPIAVSLEGESGLIENNDTESDPD